MPYFSKKLQLKKIHVLLLVLFTYSNLWAEDYYINANSGNDSNNGTSPNSAWKTLEKVNAFTFSPGDNLFFRSGQVWNGQLLLNNSGTNGNPIKVDKYGNGNKPIINGGGLLTNSAATVLIKNAEYIEINNLELTNTNGDTDYQGDLWAILGELDIAGGMEANHIYIRNCFIHDVNGDVATKTTGGIYMTAFGEDPSRYNDLRIENNEIDNIGGLGIANQSSYASIASDTRYPSLNIKIRGNRISNTGRNNLIIRASDGSVVEYNTFVNSSRHDTGHSIFCFNTDKVLIQYNETYGNTGSGNKDRGAYDADYNCKNTIIQYNYSHDNFWGFAIMKRAVNENVTIRYNISENDSKAIYFYGFENQSGMTTANIYNNTHYLKSGIKISVFGRDGFKRTAIKTNFSNNIFHFEDSGSVWGEFNSGSVNFRNNCFYNIEALGTNFITSNPRLISPNAGEKDIDWSNYPNVLVGYKLQENSPCIDAGRNISNNGGFDFWGEPLYNGAADIGASEYRKPIDSGEKDIFLVIGEANAAGRATIEAKDRITSQNILLLNNQGQWEIATNPANRHSTIRKDISDQKLGYAHAFGKFLNSVLSKKIGLVVNARGGSSINQWAKGASDDFYGEALARIQTAMNIPGSNLKGVLWHQGESNRNDGLAYITKLQGIINSLRTDLNLPNLPFIAGQLSQEKLENEDFNMTILPTLSNTVSNTDYANSDCLGTTNLTHFDSEAQRILGGRYASKILNKAYGFRIVTDTIWVKEDSYVRAGRNANQNYNSEGVLRVKTSSNQDFTRESYLKFDLSGVQNDKIIDANLIVNGLSSEGGSIDVTVFETTDNWSESNITWNNKPTSGKNLEVLTVSEEQDTNYKIFLSEYAQETQDSDNVLSIVIKNATNTSGQFRFKSKEDLNNQKLRPYLLVTTVTNNILNVPNDDLDPSDKIEEVFVYPNPVSDILYFKNLFSNNVSKIEMFNINGKLIANHLDLSSIKNSGLNTKQYSKGLYLMRFFKKNGQIVNKKIIIR